jgi:hypothetical protein
VNCETASGTVITTPQTLIDLTQLRQSTQP